MKPAVAMDGKASCAIEPTTVASSKRRLVIVVSVIALVSVVVIAGVTTGSFMLGLHAGKDSYKEAWLTFTAEREDGESTIIKERLIVQGQETKMIRPGVLSMVVDYEKNMMVMQHDRELNGDEQLQCFVYDFEQGMFGTLEKEEAVVRAGQGNLTVPMLSDVLELEYTGETVPLTELSPLARQMCFETEVLRAHRTLSGGMVKRAAAAAAGGCCCTCGCCSCTCTHVRRSEAALSSTLTGTAN